MYLLEILDAGDDLRMFRSNFSSKIHEEPEIKPNFENSAVYRIHKKIRRNRREYKIFGRKEQELMSANGGWRTFVKGLIFLGNSLRIFLIVLAIIIIETINPYGNLIPINIKIYELNPFLNEKFIFIVIPTIIIPAVLILTGVILLLDVSIFTIQDHNRLSIGEIRGNIPLFGRTNWKVFGFSKKNQAFVRLPGFKILEKSTLFHIGKIETPIGLYKATVPLKILPTDEFKGYYVPTKCDITDSNNNLCFTVTWVKYKPFLRQVIEYRIDSPIPMSPFLTFTISVCLIEKFLSNYENYDFSQSNTYGLDSFQ